jgi:hypothetical protein
VLWHLVFGCLTFEVTCVRQRDALARRSRMSVARFAAPVWHAVARQVHRVVRHHCGHSQKVDFHVSAPSSIRMRTLSICSGLKFRMLTPILVSGPASGGRGSQQMVQPQVLQRTTRSVLSPWMYSWVCSG